MSDLVYEAEGKNESNKLVQISFTRFWGDGKQDWIQITFVSESGIDAYCQLPFVEFEKAYNASCQSVEETRNAWWHHSHRIMHGVG